MERVWWERTLLVLRRPAEVFAALRGEDDGSRSEPLLAIVFLAGIAGVLGTNAFSHALDDFELDGLTLAVVAFISGGLYGLVGYFLLGFLAYAGARAAGSDVSFGRARQIVGFAVVPLALSLLVWFLRIAIYGGDPFRTGGSDTGLREPPLRGGRGRGARVVGRPARRRDAARTTAGRSRARSLRRRLRWRSPRWLLSARCSSRFRRSRRLPRSRRR